MNIHRARKVDISFYLFLRPAQPLCKCGVLCVSRFVCVCVYSAQCLQLLNGISVRDKEKVTRVTRNASKPIRARVMKYVTLHLAPLSRARWNCVAPIVRVCVYHLAKLSRAGISSHLAAQSSSFAASRDLENFIPHSSSLRLHACVRSQKAKFFLIYSEKIILNNVLSEKLLHYFCTKKSSTMIRLS